MHPIIERNSGRASPEMTGSFVDRRSSFLPAAAFPEQKKTSDEPQTTFYKVTTNRNSPYQLEGIVSLNTKPTRSIPYNDENPFSNFDSYQAKIVLPQKKFYRGQSRDGILYETVKGEKFFVMYKGEKIHELDTPIHGTKAKTVLWNRQKVNPNKDEERANVIDKDNPEQKTSYDEIDKKASKAQQAQDMHDKIVKFLLCNWPLIVMRLYVNYVNFDEKALRNTFRAGEIDLNDLKVIYQYSATGQLQKELFMKALGRADIGGFGPDGQLFTVEVFHDDGRRNTQRVYKSRKRKQLSEQMAGLAVIFREEDGDDKIPPIHGYLAHYDHDKDSHIVLLENQGIIVQFT